MTQAKPLRGSTAGIDAVCAATGWNRYYVTGYLYTWHESTKLAGISTVNLREILNSLPEQPYVAPDNLLAILMRAGYISRDMELNYTITANAPAKRKKRDVPVKLSTCNHWPSYAAAYHRRYGQIPVRNARANTNMKSIENCIGCDDMDAFLLFYVEHDSPRYTSKMHQLGSALIDADALHTQMRNGQPLMPGKVRGDAATSEMRSQVDRVMRGELGR